MILRLRVESFFLGLLASGSRWSSSPRVPWAASCAAYLCPPCSRILREDQNGQVAIRSGMDGFKAILLECPVLAHFCRDIHAARILALQVAHFPVCWPRPRMTLTRHAHYSQLHRRAAHQNLGPYQPGHLGPKLCRKMIMLHRSRTIDEKTMPFTFWG